MNQRDKKLENDEIDGTEAGFMEGYIDEDE